ncbi:hypothetical protein L7F22_053560 [Adiantum nelumboides]|nr:hypothetical protein [Adiantum nelumboides]
MASPPPGADGHHHLPFPACSFTTHHAHLLLEDCSTGYGLLEYSIATPPLDELCLQPMYGTTECCTASRVSESAVCNLQPRVLKRLPSFVDYVTPPQALVPLCCSSSHSEDMSGLTTDNNLWAGLSTLLEEFNAEFVPPLKHQESFKFPSSSDQFNLGGAASTRNAPLIYGLDVCHNQIGGVNATEIGVSQLENRVWDDTTDAQQLDQSKLPGVQSSFLPPTSSPTCMEGTLYTREMSQTMQPLHSLNVTATPSFFCQNFNSEFEAPTLSASCCQVPTI